MHKKTLGDVLQSEAVWVGVFQVLLGQPVDLLDKHGDAVVRVVPLLGEYSRLHSLIDVSSLPLE